MSRASTHGPPAAGWGALARLREAVQADADQQCSAQRAEADGEADQPRRRRQGPALPRRRSRARPRPLPWSAPAALLARRVKPTGVAMATPAPVSSEPTIRPTRPPTMAIRNADLSVSLFARSSICVTCATTPIVTPRPIRRVLLGPSVPDAHRRGPATSGHGQRGGHRSAQTAPLVILPLRQAHTWTARMTRAGRTKAWPESQTDWLQQPEPRPQPFTQEPESRCPASTGIAQTRSAPKSLPKSDIDKGSHAGWTPDGACDLHLLWSGWPDLNRRPLRPEAKSVPRHPAALGA
jgi:hypothetical protein